MMNLKACCMLAAVLITIFFFDAGMDNPLLSFGTWIGINEIPIDFSGL